MEWFSLMAIAVGLAMDAFAVAIVTGLTVKPLTKRHVFRLAFHFGLFQFLMPLLGWVAGTAVQKYIANSAHWVAFGLLTFVGGHMIWSSLASHEEGKRATRDPTSGWALVVLSVATSIDALAVGLSLAIIGSRIILPAVVIGMVAAAFTAVGMALGRQVGSAWGKRVEVLGGLILFAIGVKIVLDHVFL
ncbi:MAG TPA: manganese efflux pump MntP family protein [Acidobacteriota bacterium]|nr:manganese efflux pump MntP family protein [Acidobacteriota bacterium]